VGIVSIRCWALLGPLSVSSASAWAVLCKILHEGRLKGTANWTYGRSLCLLFRGTDSRVQFSLVELAASESERPRHEPYGVAVSKEWLFRQGGRPVIYEHPANHNALPEALKYRFVPYDPVAWIDFSWERECRIQADYLKLEPTETLVIVPSATEAFDLVYEFAKEEVDGDEDGPTGVNHVAKWLAVSLDIFGFAP
jgi:hypothetical protein